MRSHLEVFTIFCSSLVNRAQIIENLRHIPCAPSVQMQEVPRDYTSSDDEDDEMDVDTRITSKDEDLFIAYRRW